MACRYTYKGKTYEAWEFEDVLRAMQPAEAAAFMPGVRATPSAPFVTDTKAWTALALKRMIRFAVDNGLDVLAWTTGEQQAARYSLARQLSAVEVDRGHNDYFKIDAYDKSGDQVIFGKTATEDMLPNLVGKELAEKMIAAEPGRHTFSGLDLEVGGEGMNAFYDGIVPQAARDVLKKLGGGEIRPINLQTIGRLDMDEQPGFRLTDRMRELAGRGMPLFARGPSLAKRIAMDTADLIDNHQWDTVGAAHEYLIDDRGHGDEFMAEAARIEFGTGLWRKPSKAVREFVAAVLRRAHDIEQAENGEPLFSRAAPPGTLPRPTNPVQGAMIPPAQPVAPPQQGAVNLQGGAILPASTWDMPAPTWLDTLIYRLQDKHIDLKRVQDAIKAAGRQITDAYNAYLKEELFHGRSATRVKEFLDNELDPLIADMRARSVSQEDLGEFLWARHAPEANARIATINPQMPDGGSGMTNAEAAQYMAGLTPERRVDLAALAARVDAITQGTRDLLVQYKLISAQDRQDLESLYQFYVPLYREDMDTMLHGTGTGQGYSVRGPETRRRTGSALPVVDILGNIANQRDKAIVRGEKARVGRALYALALTNKNPQFWRTDRPPMIKTVTMVNGQEQVVERPDPLFKTRDNVVVVKVPTRKGNIVERAIIFNERDPRAMRMAHAIKNLDGQELGDFLGATAVVTRYFASINTQYNPIFGVVNFIRDVQTAALNLSSTPLAGRQAEVMGSALRIVAGAAKHGLRAFDGTWRAIAQEFEEAGGMTGYRDVFRTGRERTEAIQKALDPNWWQKRPWGKALTANGYLKAPAELLADSGVRPVMEWLTDYNQVLENATRLAAYKAGRDAGLSVDQAASIAKNLTVNFNRKGELALQLGALYAFFNAATQGIARMGQTLAGPAGKYIIGGGVLLGVLQGALLAAAGYDDDEPPQFVRERALIFPTPWREERYVSLPMPLGFNVLPNLGRLAFETATGGDPSEKAASLMAVLADAFNPLGGSAPVAQILAPTAADPFVALSMNRDWTNKPIAREDFSSLHPTPGFARARDAASGPARWLAKTLNRLSGGTDFTPGIASPTPDQIDYLAGQLTGGIGREAIKAATTVDALITGDELPAYKVPLVGRFYGSTEGQAPQANRFYANLRRLNLHQAEVKGLREAGRGNEAMRYLVDHPEARLHSMASRLERDVRDLQARRRALKERGASQAEIRRLDDQVTARMARLNEAMKKSSRASSRSPS